MLPNRGLAQATEEKHKKNPEGLDKGLDFSQRHQWVGIQ